MHTEPAPAETFDTIVIGGGQTGLTVGHRLRQAARDFVILEAGTRVGDAWRARWDSLLLFTPGRLNGLPGMPFPARRDEFVTKDQMADYLGDYADHFDLPVRLNTRVERVSRCGDGFEVFADGRLLRSSNVVVATSSYGSSKTPSFARELDSSIVQLHSAHSPRSCGAPGSSRRFRGSTSRCWATAGSPSTTEVSSSPSPVCTSAVCTSSTRRRPTPSSACNATSDTS